MITLLSLMMLLGILGIIIGSVSVVSYDILEKKMEHENSNKAIRTEEELMSIIYSLIERKWNYRLLFHFKFKEIKVPNFEFELNYLVKEVISSLSVDVLEELKYYYNNEETVIKTVSEIVQIFLLDYMDKNGVKHK